MPSHGPATPSIRETGARSVGHGATRAAPRRTGSATVTLIASVAFVAVTIALGLGLETTPPRTGEGWRLRGTLADAASAAAIATSQITRLPAWVKVV